MFRIIIQNVTPQLFSPSGVLLRRWTKKALSTHLTAAEVGIRIVNVTEMIHLNATYRGKKRPTNILSFKCDPPNEVKLAVPPIGDLVICSDVVNREAVEQDKPVAAHWAHMVIHGSLHLLGYDHEEEQEALLMENLEIDILTTFNFPNPYINHKEDDHNE